MGFVPNTKQGSACVLSFDEHKNMHIVHFHLFPADILLLVIFKASLRHIRT